MSIIGQVNQGSAATSVSESAQNLTTAPVKAEHSQLGAATISIVSNSDLAEEVAMLLTNFTNPKSNKKDKKEKKSLEQALKAQQKKVPDMPDAGQLTSLLHKLKGQMKSKNLSEEGIKKLVQGYSEDPTHQHLGMELIIEQLADSQDTEDQALLQVLQQHQTQFYSENEQDIKAGVNVSNLAQQYSKTTSFELGDLRTIWRDVLHDMPELKSGSSALGYAKKLGDNKQDKIVSSIDFMREALAIELGLVETERAASPTHLLHVRQQLEVLYGLKTLFIECDSVEAQVNNIQMGEA